MEEREFLLELLKGNEPAVDLCLMVGRISHVWDDVLDGDRPVSALDLHQAFFDAMITVQEHPFMVQHRADLQPALRLAIFDWIAANELEEGSDHDRTLAFCLRDSLSAFAVQCAHLIGGPAYAAQNSARVRRFFQDETLQQYLGGEQ